MGESGMEVELEWRADELARTDHDLYQFIVARERARAFRELAQLLENFAKVKPA